MTRTSPLAGPAALGALTALSMFIIYILASFEQVLLHSFVLCFFFSKLLLHV